MKFVIFVEGHTEKRCIGDFLKRWLVPKLKKSVDINVVRFEGCGDFNRKASKKAKYYLEEEPDRSETIAIIGLLDLYGPKFYPPDKTSVRGRHDWAVEKFQQEVNNDKFRMFFAVHELEAWLLSQPDILPESIRDELPTKASDSPEMVNFDEPPAKLLEKLYKEKPGKGYKKVVDGTELFKKLDPSVAYRKCPHLKEMLDTMLTFANNVSR